MSQSEKQQILVLEDDPKLSNEIKIFLETLGYDVYTFPDGLEILTNYKQLEPSLFILDINVPIINGIDVCKKIREHNQSAPIIMLTAFGDLDHKVKALDSGADDYLSKPFHFEELHARIRALIRRSLKMTEGAESIKIHDLEIIPESMQVFRAGKQIMLTPKEYKLLLALARGKGKALSKQVIAEEVWDINFETGTNTIEVYINFLRNKVDKGFSKKLIHTRPGFGYYIKMD
ncbi:response regulator transcription factor [Bacteroidota bacterium]